MGCRPFHKILCGLTTIYVRYDFLKQQMHIFANKTTSKLNYKDYSTDINNSVGDA